MPGQPSLPPGVGERSSGRAGDSAQQLVPPLSLAGDVSRVGPSTALPRLAEDALGAAAALTVGGAIQKLRAMRAALLAQLTPQESYTLAKRSLVNQAHVRATLELVEGGGASKRQRLA